MTDIALARGNPERLATLLSAGVVFAYAAAVLALCGARAAPEIVASMVENVLSCWALAFVTWAFMLLGLLLFRIVRRDLAESPTQVVKAQFARL